MLENLFSGSPMYRLLSVLSAIVLLFIWLAPDNSPERDNSAEHQSGVIPTVSSLAVPLQKSLQSTDKGAQAFNIDEYTLQPKAKIHITARLLGKERYRLGRESDLSPIDLALGWGPMADPAITDQIKITQSGRWFHWRTDQLPIPRRDIETSASNVHIIPANQTVKDQLSRIDEGDIVQISGQLVDIESPDGFFWRTSMTREDTGAGACEILYATHIDVLPDPF
jgi:hypothetical protein